MQQKIAIVFDTSVLVAFSCVDRIDLLKNLFTAAVIPGAVFRELVDQGMGWQGAEAAQREAVSKKWLGTVVLRDEQITLVGDPNLDDGEREVISLALAWGLIPAIDEIFGRREAQTLSLDPIGSLGILGIAKQKGLVAELGPIVSDMKNRGIRLGDRLIGRFLRQYGERWPP